MYDEHAYRKRPVEIRAIQWHGDNFAQICKELDPTIEYKLHVAGDKLEIPTLEGVMLASPGDWIIKGVQGELYPRKPAIFEETYEKVIDDIAERVIASGLKDPERRASAPTSETLRQRAMDRDG